MHLTTYYEALEEFKTADTVEAVTSLCQHFCEWLGFDAFAYALRTPVNFSDSRVILINGYPTQWRDHYFNHAYFSDDPTIAYCSKHILPVQWHHLFKVIDSPMESRRVMHEAAEFGLRAGISMPVHSSQGELGILSLALDQPHRTAQETTQHALPYVQLLAAYIHEAVRRVFGLIEKESLIHLTPREKECLVWAADGKTSWETSQLLSISERTVNFHINNSTAKLNVSNRQHAIAKAILHGLINPQPF